MPGRARILAPDLGTRILVPGSWYQDLGTKIYGAPERLRLSGFPFFFGIEILVPRSWYQDLGTKILVQRSWYQHLGTKIFGGTGPEVTGQPPSRFTLTDIPSLL